MISISQKIKLKFYLFFVSVLFGDDSWKVYDDSEIAVVEITVAPEDLIWIYENVESDSLHLATIHYQNAFIDEIIDSVGFRLRGNTSRNAQKKSFKLDFNHFISGREFYDVEKINLNGEHNDPSIVRSKLCWDIFQEIGVTSSRAVHAKVFINGEYYGLYISVEHIDDTFLKRNYDDDSGNLWKCIWPADLTYRGDNPEDYHPYYDDNRPYELKTNTDEYDYSKLARLIRIIHQTPDSLEMVLNMKETLQYLAVNILTGSWDDYRFLRNNFYLYHNPTDDLIHWIPYDYDNTFSIDWFDIDWSTIDPYDYAVIDNDGRPLTEYLFSQSRYRTLFTHFLSFYNQMVLNEDTLDLKLDYYVDFLLESAALDNYRTYDYGFTVDDFVDSYGTDYDNQHVKQGMRDFITERKYSLDTQLNFEELSPIIYEAKFDYAVITNGQEINLNASMYGMADQFFLFYLREGETEWHSVNLEYSPDSMSHFIEDHDRWSTTLFPEEEGTYYWYLFASNEHGGERYPVYDFESFEVIGLFDLEGVVINELLAKNETINEDEAGEYDDWLELWNYGTESIDLSNYYLTDNPNNPMKWLFPSDIVINPDEYLIVWCDEDQEQGILHTNFKLSSDGEYLALIAPDGMSIVDSLTFPEQEEDVSFGRLSTDNSSWDYMNPTPGSMNEMLSTQNELSSDKFRILRLFPNPFNSKITIELNIHNSQKNIKIYLYTLLGQIVGTTNYRVPNSGLQSISVDFSSNQISSGVYILKLESGNYIKTKKIIYLK